MKPKTTGLGKGLGAIFEIEELNIPKQTAASRRDNTVADIELGRITPNPAQPRTLFDEETLDELAQSISRLGVIQPITVKRIENPAENGPEYMIISGERRFRASQMAGMDTIPAYIREANDQTLLEMALVENIQREDLGAIEVALSLQRLIDECSLTQEILAERVGKKRSTIANYIRLLRLRPHREGAPLRASDRNRRPTGPGPRQGPNRQRQHRIPGILLPPGRTPRTAGRQPDQHQTQIDRR